MRRWVTAGILAAGAAVLAGLGLTAVARQRERADRAGCLQRFERLGRFAAVYERPPKGLPADQIPQAVPPGTVPNPNLPPDRRLSWVAGALPLLDQTLQGTADLAARLDPTAAWDAGPNREVGAVRLALLTCPGAVPDPLPDGAMPTQFVGLAGVGADAAALPPDSPHAGCFRYDAPTPLKRVRDGDGLSNTLLFAETAAELGPWIRGGFATVRGLDVAAGAKPFLGRGGQFGGNYPGVVGFGRADGSAFFATDRMSLAVLRAHLTIAGGEVEGIPGE